MRPNEAKKATEKRSHAWPGIWHGLLTFVRVDALECFFNLRSWCSLHGSWGEKRRKPKYRKKRKPQPSKKRAKAIEAWPTQDAPARPANDPVHCTHSKHNGVGGASMSMGMAMRGRQCKWTVKVNVDVILTGRMGKHATAGPSMQPGRLLTMVARSTRRVQSVLGESSRGDKQGFEGPTSQTLDTP